MGLADLEEVRKQAVEDFLDSDEGEDYMAEEALRWMTWISNSRVWIALEALSYNYFFL